MIVIQVFFGLGEAGAFPIATRSLSRWMLPAERGFAQGITHAGSRLGAALTPTLVVLLMAAYGWRAAFFVFGLMGLFWAAVWLAGEVDVFPSSEDGRVDKPAMRQARSRNAVRRAQRQAARSLGDDRGALLARSFTAPQRAAAA